MTGFPRRWGALFFVAYASATSVGCRDQVTTSTPLTRHTIAADGHPLTLWEKRPAQPGAAILLLHGRTWSALPDFDLQVPGEELSLMDALVGRGYATYALDMRGYGATPRDSTGWLTPDRAAADVAIILDWIAANAGVEETPALLGWSLGSMVAQFVVQRHPGKVSDVILYGYPRDPDTEIAEHPDTGPPPRTPNTAEAAASDFITPGSVSQTVIDAYVAAALAADPVHVDWRRWHQFNELEPAAVHIPTLILQGEHDPLAKPEYQARLFTDLGHPNRQWIVIAGADHAAHLERPRARFVQAVVMFLRRPRQ